MRAVDTPAQIALVTKKQYGRRQIRSALTNHAETTEISSKAATKMGRSKL
jgi:hypothetical protein